MRGVRRVLLWAVTPLALWAVLAVPEITALFTFC
jgi:hypothetical protein